MAKEVATSEQIASVPQFMGGAEGTELMAQFIRPPRLKVVQKMSGDQFSSKFAVGDVVLVPYMVRVAEHDKPFYVTPLYFYPEWITVNPIATRGSEMMIRERSMDPRSVIAIKARDANTRTEGHPDREGLFIRHVECLNFLVMIENGQTEEPCTMTFSRGSWREGSQFAGLIKLRKAPVYGCRFEVITRKKINDKQQDWYAFTPQNPEQGSPWVDEDAYKRNMSLHLMLKEAHASNTIRADYDDASVEGEFVDSEAGKSDKF